MPTMAVELGRREPTARMSALRTVKTFESASGITVMCDIFPEDGCFDKVPAQLPRNLGGEAA